MRMRFLQITIIGLAIAFSASAATKKGQKFPKFKLKTLQTQKTTKNKDLMGKFIVVDVWASWCEPCKFAIPAYDKIREKYKAKGLDVIGLNVDDNRDDAMKFLESHPAKFQHLFDKEKDLVRKLGVEAMPTTYVINPKGKVIYIKRGFRPGDEKKLEKFLVKRMKKK